MAQDEREEDTERKPVGEQRPGRGEKDDDDNVNEDEDEEQQEQEQEEEEGKAKTRRRSQREAKDHRPEGECPANTVHNVEGEVRGEERRPKAPSRRARAPSRFRAERGADGAPKQEWRDDVEGWRVQTCEQKTCS